MRVLLILTDILITRRLVRATRFPWRRRRVRRRWLPLLLLLNRSLLLFRIIQILNAFPRRTVLDVIIYRIAALTAHVTAF